MEAEDHGMPKKYFAPRKRSSIQRFEDLDVWQEARTLVKGVYRACKTQPLAEDRDLVSQMRRAAVSVSSNIAEGHERGSRIQYIEFCCIAKGSAGELRSQVINAHDVELVNDEAYNWLHAQCEKVSGMLGNYVKHLVASAGRIKGIKFTKQSDREPFDWDAFLADTGLQRLPSGQVVRVKPLEDKSQSG